jgi:hypothetical protein
VSSPTTSPVDDRGFPHGALLSRGEDGLLAVAMPCVPEAPARDEPTPVVVRSDRLGAREGEPGTDAGNAALADVQQVGADPARLIRVHVRPA